MKPSISQNPNYTIFKIDKSKKKYSPKDQEIYFFEEKKMKNLT
jgi:hypothetical protein